jgi:hypothetical protein
MLLQPVQESSKESGMNTIEGTKNSLKCTLGIAALVLFECALAIAILLSLGIEPA